MRELDSWDIPAAVCAFIATRDTRLSALGKCLYLPRETKSSFSISFSESLPNVTMLPTNSSSCEELKTALAAFGLSLLPCHGILAQLKTQSTCSNSYNSISVSLSPGHFFPLWVATLLFRLNGLQELHCRWLQALDWIERSTLKAPPNMRRINEEVARALESLCLARPVDGLIVATVATSFKIQAEDLLCLPANAWLSNFVIDPLIRLMNHAAPPLSSGICALTLEQSTALYSASPNPSLPPSDFLSNINDHVQSGRVTRILVPTFVNGNHFTLFSLCFATQSYSYGDSLRPFARPPPAHLNALMEWAKRLKPGSWSESLPTFTIPAQQDTFSCGVVVLSMVATILFGSPDWSPELADYFRLFWFAWSANPNYQKVLIITSLEGYLNESNSSLSRIPLSSSSLCFKPPLQRENDFSLSQIPNLHCPQHRLQKDAEMLLHQMKSENILIVTTWPTLLSRRAV